MYLYKIKSLVEYIENSEQYKWMPFLDENFNYSSIEYVKIESDKETFFRFASFGLILVYKFTPSISLNVSLFIPDAGDEYHSFEIDADDFREDIDITELVLRYGRNIQLFDSTEFKKEFDKIDRVVRNEYK